ncbi:SAM-dependent DNA methyltransferase [Candidatus Bipolaricaulota bacterium]|nr:SAM-dependent DNA methyltransferase [Candidatus Bipolaricaulota bacterium]
MNVGQERDRIVSVYARRLKALLEELLPKDPNEPALRLRVEPILAEFCEKVEVSQEVRDEFVVAKGKIADAVFDRLVVEFKRPGILSRTRTREDAIAQLRDYLEGLTKKERRRRLAGVAFDGEKLLFMRFRGGRILLEPPCPVSQDTLKKFLHWLAGLSSGAALTAENLAHDFSVDQPRTRAAIGTLYDALTDSLLGKPEGMVAKLFEQWRLFFSEAIDYKEAFGGRKLEPLKKWVAKAGITVEIPEEAERFFFALHTYFALLVKLVAWLALSRHLGPKVGAPLFSTLLDLPSEELKEKLHHMERGGIFRDFGIENLLEGDFFVWYLYDWGERMEEAIRGLIRRLLDYDPTTLSIDPDETRDLLKKLYHYLLPREVRHNLGEYYTPDWLAQRLLNQVDQEFFGPVKESLRPKLRSLRWLDPACGSGTFLVLLIKRYRELGDRLMVSEDELLSAILANVVGFDINPLAVITARVNYLLALGDLLEHRKGPITIPVYLADSVLLPELGEDLETSGLYQVRTSVGIFSVPQAVFAEGRFDRFCTLLEESVRSEVPPDDFVERVVEKLGLSAAERKAAAGPLQALYEQLLELHREGLDGLWARLLKNNFAPLTVGQFDYVVGNPPWVNWEHLPDGYRQSTSHLWTRYALFPHKGFEAILGKAKDDISILMAYVAMDRFLKPGGRLGFVITQSLFKTAGAGQGFRRFQLGEQGAPLRVVHVDDMVALNPFEGASNRTAVMVLEKGKLNRYPVPYTVWRKKGRARFTYDSTLEEVRTATHTLDFFAEPVDPGDPTSPWLTARKAALRAVRKVLGKSDYTAHAGVYTGGANAVYWMEIVAKRPDGLVVVRNITKGAKRKVPEVMEVIEPDLLYPLLRGRDVKRWHAEPSAFILLTHRPGMRLKAIPEEEMQQAYPRTWAYLKRFESILRERAAFKRYFTRKDKSGKVVETGPFYSMFDVGDYTFAPWKVVWRHIASDFIIAVTGCQQDKLIMPNEKLMLVPCETPQEAFFLCGVLSSSPVRFGVRAFFVETQIAPHVIGRFNIPKYNSADPVHRALAQASKEAHEAAARGDEARLHEIEERVDALAAQLWGLTDKELAEIHRSIIELEGKG